MVKELSEEDIKSPFDRFFIKHDDNMIAYITKSFFQERHLPPSPKTLTLLVTHL